MPLPRLPAKAAYIHLKHATGTSTLSLDALGKLGRQLESYLRSPITQQLLTLPPFRADFLPLLQDKFEDFPDYRWLTNTTEWDRQFAHKPSVLVLRSDGPEFCTGYDIKELTTLTQFEVKEIFMRVKDILALMRHSPIPIVCPVQGLADGPGFQLAATADFPIALADTPFRLSGMRMGLPSVAAAVQASRIMSPAKAYRLFASGDVVTAKQLGSDVLDIVDVPEHAEAVDTAARDFEARVASVIEKLATETPAQAQAIGKWSYWTQLAIRRSEDGGDGYDAANYFSAQAMAAYSRSGAAREGLIAWKEKRKPVWKNLQDVGPDAQGPQDISEQNDSEMEADAQAELNPESTDKY